MKKTTVIVSLLVFLGLCGSAAAAEKVVFGPAQYIRTGAEPNVYSDNFTATAGMAKLTIRNGTFDGDRRVDDGVSSAIVSVNGVEIFGPNKFNKNIHYLEAVLDLAEENTITVELRSAPDSYIFVEVTKDVPPPSVSIGANPGAINAGESVTLNWTSDHTDTCSIEPGIGNVSLDGSMTVFPQETLTYILTGRGPGGTSTASVDVVVNRPPAANAQIVATDEDAAAFITLSGSDPDGDPLVFWVVADPGNGTLAGVPPHLTYTPNNNFNGADAFSFKADDGKLDSDQALVSITVSPVNDTPSADAGPDQSVFRGDTVVLDGSGSEDADGDVLTYLWSLVSAPPGSIAAFSDPAQLRTLFVPDLSGSYEIVLKASDAGLTSASDSMLLTVTPRQVQVPDVVNLLLADAEGVIAGAELSLGNVTTQNNDTVPEDIVLIQSPPAGTSVEEGAPVDMVVSSGPAYFPPFVEISATPVNPPNPFLGSYLLSWTSTDADACVIEPGIGNVDPNGSIGIWPESETTYTITATGPGGTATAGVTIVQPLPEVIINADPQNVLVGETTSLSWSSSYADTVTIDHEIGAVGASGAIEVSPAATTTYTITATGPGGTVTASVTVVTNYPLPVIEIAAAPEAIFFGGSAILTWHASNADICVIDPGVGNVGNIGSITVTPAQTTAYTITATGPGGTSSSVVTVNVDIPPPRAMLSANPESILPGESSTLSWTNKYADSASIDSGIGNVALSDSMQISPSETTTYEMTAVGPGGTTVERFTVKVNLPPPSVAFYAENETIRAGEASTLFWNSVNAQSAHIDHGVGTVTANGTATVSPTATTTYTITVSGAHGSASKKATIAVIGEPEPQPEGSFGRQYEDMVPPDATIEAYDARRFSLITGFVQASDGFPLSEVKISIHGHPEYGTAASNAQGIFSIPVEGGGNLTLIYEKEGLITAHRKVQVPWNEIAVAEDIQMVSRDTIATTMAFDGNSETVISHRSSEVVDEFGSRSTTMVFTGDNRAFLLDEDGNDVHELNTISARVTEFNTFASMPARLPSNSAYTYCVELGVDGAQRVRFEKPVVVWVDNFLGFGVGEPVPLGYYDRDRGLWIPSDNGVVVKLLDTDADGVVDALDEDGDDQPDDLDNDGNFSSETKGLDDAQRYTSGSTFWRVAVTHFTPWDCNWPYGPPLDATPANPPGVPVADAQKAGVKACKEERASSVDERNRIFYEEIPIPGTDITLNYASNRVTGYRTVIDVPASGASVSQSLKRIVARVQIAGKTLENVLDPLPDQSAEFVWDGLDRFGREVAGNPTAHVSVGFVYDAFYYSAGDFSRAFGQSGSNMTAIRARREIYSWQNSDIVLPRKKGWGAIAEGWTLSGHHNFNPAKPSFLYKGNGDLIRNYNSIINTVAGGGTSYSDGIKATDAILSNVFQIAFDRAGNLYLIEPRDIRRIDTSGAIATVPGGNLEDYPYGLAVDAAGNIYVSLTGYHFVVKIDPNGVRSVVAGTGVYGYSGDGGPAVNARLNQPTGLAVDAEDNLYISDTGNGKIRKVDADGIITTVFEGGARGLALDKAGNLYISNDNSVRKLETSGNVTTVAGTGKEGYSGDGGPAVQARLNSVQQIAVDAEGNLYIADRYNHCIRKVDVCGIITTVAGSGTGGFSGDGGPATEAKLSNPFGVAVDPKGNVFVADSFNNRIRKIAADSIDFETMSIGDVAFVEENGPGYVMSSDGRHKKTLDPDTGSTLFQFAYNADKNLVSIADRFGNEMIIERDLGGIPTALISPHGLRTELKVDADNHLTRLVYPDGNYFDFQYTSDGLMTVKIEPKGNRFDHVFDQKGRMTDVSDEEGGHWNYQRRLTVSGEVLTEVLSEKDDRTTYLDRFEPSGAFSTIIMDPAGAQTLFTQMPNGLLSNKSLPCGMELELKYGLDSRYKFKYLKEIMLTAPSGLRKIIAGNKTYQDTDAKEVPEIITETLTVNGKSSTLENDLLLHRKTIASPETRTVYALYNPDTLLIETIQVPGLFDTAYGYDTKGRLISINRGARQTSFAYNDQGFLESVVDPGGHTTAYIYDAAGRMIGIERPDTGSIGFSYDANGNLTLLTNPSYIDHGFGFDKVNMNNSYQTPLSGFYGYVYDKDRRPVQITFPSGRQIDNIWVNGRLERVRTAEVNIDYAYLCGTKIDSITKGTESIAYGYDGNLVTSEISTGTLNQSLGYTYNNDFNLFGLTYADGTTNYIYDDDGLLTGAGGFSIDRNAQNGLPEKVFGGPFSMNLTFNGYGEVAGEDFAVGSNSLISWNLVRDNNGRITTKTESFDGISSVYVYTYDPMGRLQTVSKDNALVEEYAYDTNGTRIYEKNVLRNVPGKSFVFDDEDHLLSAGSVFYAYDLDGYLSTKTEESKITAYEYSSRGELLEVILPDNAVIEYIHDPIGRRIAKKINGSIVEKYLWQSLTRLLAVYDASENLLMRFEYADTRMPFAMTKGGSTYYFAYDQIGSLRAVADAFGNVVKRIEYDSFGNIIRDSAPSFTVPFGFAGGLHDRDTGLVRFGYRDYDPETGRWTAKDPIFFAGGDADLYGYCLNNPISFIDPNGRIGLPGLIVGTVAGATTGLLSGLQSGNTMVAIAAGALGGFYGGLIGIIAPQLGVVTGKIVAGTIGGGVAGFLGKGWSSPCSSPMEVFTAGFKGGAFGAIMGGTFGAGITAATTYLGAQGTAAEITSAMISASVGLVPGVVIKE